MRTSTAASLGLGLLTLGAALLTLQNFQRAARQPADETTQQVPRYTLRDAHWTRLNEQGQPEYIAQARSIDYYDDESSKLEAPRITAFGGRGSPWELTAPTGSMPPHSRDVLLSGNVRMQGQWKDSRELRLDTPRLWLDTQRKVLHTDAEVLVNSPGRQLKATGLIADADGQHVQLLGKVRGVYQPDKVPES